MRALKICNQKLPVRLKILIFQAYIIGKFRFLLISLKMYPRKNVEAEVWKVIMSLLKITLGISKNVRNTDVDELLLIKDTI